MSDPNKTRKERILGSLGKVIEGVTTGLRMQTRFTLIPLHRLNKETIAGIRDMTLGSIKNGVRVGRPIIRFDTGLNTNTFPHINIDPKGKISMKNPHIAVSAELVTASNKIHKAFDYVGVTMAMLTLAIDTWRISKDLYDDIYAMNHADKLIEELTFDIQQLEDKLRNENNPEIRKNIEESIEYPQKYLTDCQRAKKYIPSKTIGTASSIVGGLSGGYVGGCSGAFVGAKTGTVIGMIFGPAGATVCAPIGAVIGAVSGGILGGLSCSKGAETLAEEGMKLTD